MKLSPAFLVLLIIFLGCKKTEVVDMDLKCATSARKGDDTKIVGKWKLVKGETAFIPITTEDYSCNEVIYEFRSDGSLIVTSNIDKYIGSSPGTYEYKFTNSRVQEGVNQSNTLQINQRSVACDISEGVMKLDDSPVDGPILHLVRL